MFPTSVAFPSIVRRAARSLSGTLASLALVALPLLASCNAKEPPEPIPLPGLEEIVERHTVSALDLSFEPGETTRQLLSGFRLEYEREVRDRDALIQAWQGTPALADNMNLDEEVFRAAEKDGSWAEVKAAAGFEMEDVPERVFADGFWKGLDEYLSQNS